MEPATKALALGSWRSCHHRTEGWTTAAPSSKLGWRRNSCLGRSPCPTGQETACFHASIIRSYCHFSSLCRCWALQTSQWMVLFICCSQIICIFRMLVQHISNCSAMQFSGWWRLFFSPFIFPPLTCAARSSLASSRSRKSVILCYVCRIHFILLGWAKTTPLLSHTQLICTAALLLHSKTETWLPERGRVLHSTVLLTASPGTSLTVIFKSPWSLNKCSSHTLHLFPTELKTH